jgi:hypothetical protein
VLIQARAVSRRGQAVSETTVAEALTDAEGRWSVPLLSPPLPVGSLSLRALCTGAAGYGAAVSVPLSVKVAAPVTPAAPPSAAAPGPTP